MIPPMAVQDISLENLREECRIPFFGPLKRGECRIPHSGDTQWKECRMPFFGPLKGACPSLCPQKARRHSSYVYAKINIYD